MELVRPQVILFVDDNADLASACQLSLREQGFAVMTASSGIEAVALCKEEAKAQVAIVDLKMPGLDGLETMAELRKQIPKLRIIAVSGQQLSPYFARLADLGVRHFVPKPFSLDALVFSIRELACEEGA